MSRRPSSRKNSGSRPRPDMDNTKKPGRGRPSGDQPGIRVSTWLRVKEFDRLSALASRRGDSVSLTVRQLVVSRLSDASE